MFDRAKDFIHTEENWRQRGEDMGRYFTELFRKHDAISSPEFKANFDFDFAELAEKHSRVAIKVRKDPELLRRAMTFLGITGEVLNPQYDQAPTLAERVFLRPQWLVDIMKELVHHDLRLVGTLVRRPQSRTDDGVGSALLQQGVLDRRLFRGCGEIFRSTDAKRGRAELRAGLLTQPGCCTGATAR